jgi:hypothetical protein
MIASTTKHFEQGHAVFDALPTAANRRRIDISSIQCSRPKGVEVRIPLLPLATAVPLLLAGCQTPEASLKQRADAIPEAQRAYIVGTLAVACRPSKDNCIQAFNAITAYYRSTDGGNLDGRLSFVSGSMFGNDTVPDTIRAERRDKLSHFCIALPPGAYQVYAYDFYNYAGGGSGYRLSKDKYFDLPFTLAPGEVAYLGTLKLTTEVGQNIFGMKLAAPGVLLLSSSPETGIPAALQKCPESVRGRTVRDASLRAGDALKPVVMADPQP